MTVPPSPDAPSVDPPTAEAPWQGDGPDDTRLAAAADGWIEHGLATAPADRAAAEAAARLAYVHAGLTPPDRVEWAASPVAGALAAARLTANDETGDSVVAVAGDVSTPSGAPVAPRVATMSKSSTSSSAVR